MTVLSVEDLRISYRSRGEWREVVHNISFSIQRGEMLAFVGESGSGKTTTAQAIIGLLADNARRDAGRIVLNGEVISDWSDKRLNRLRGVSISLVPQDPGNSLNPVKTIGQQVEEILRLHQSLSAAERRQQALNLLAKVGLSHPEQRFDQYPHQLSGGMKQRVLIAIAIALQPDLIIADEPTSALDVTVQKRVRAALDAGLTVILCVGETLEQREQGVTGEVVALQTKIALQGVAKDELARVIIAYEPVWAIGTGKTPTPEDVEEVHAAVRKVLAKKLGKGVANKMRILYGGSVKPSNAKEFLSLPDVDGALIGGASLKAQDFLAIAKSVC